MSWGNKPTLAISPPNAYLNFQSVSLLQFVSDAGEIKRFTSKVLDIKHLLTTPYHAQADGLSNVRVEKL